MLTRTIDRLIYLAAAIAALAACIAQVQAQEFNDESPSARLQRALEYNLDQLGERVTDIEQRVESIDERVAKIERQTATREKTSQAAQPPSAATRLTQAQLVAWVKRHYQPSTRLHASVEPPGMVWSHLQDANHGFLREQVQGLEFWVAYALHDASHARRITPFAVRDSTAAATPPAPARFKISPQPLVGSGCDSRGCSRPLKFRKRKH